MDRPIDQPPVPATTRIRHVEVVVNPTAGSFRKAKLERFVAQLRARGVTASVRHTKHAGHLTEIAETLDPGVDALIVGGGDGSISEAVAGLMKRGGSLPVIGVLPFGTANVLAHELGLPFRPDHLADVVANGRTRPLHPGLVGDRPFILMVSAGFDGAAVHAVDPVLKRRFGKLAYVAASLRVALSRPGPDVVLDVDGETVRCRMAVVTTARFYGGPMAITRATDVTRPGLRLITLASDTLYSLARAGLGLATGRLDRVPGVVDRPVERVRFLGPAVSMQVDGDRLATTDALVVAAPVVLRVLVP